MVDEHRGAYGVKRLCRVVGVSRSGFYAWAARSPSARATRDQELIAVIVEIHARSRRTYGSPRVHAELRRLDQRCSRKRVARLMRTSGLVALDSTGDCYDNAAVEAFWATLKRELAWIHNTTTWPNPTELRSALFDYIEGFYNPNRIQRRLGHHSPAEYEQHAAA